MRAVRCLGHQSGPPDSQIGRRTITPLTAPARLRSREPACTRSGLFPCPRIGCSPAAIAGTSSSSPRASRTSTASAGSAIHGVVATVAQRARHSVVPAAATRAVIPATTHQQATTPAATVVAATHPEAAIGSEHHARCTKQFARIAATSRAFPSGPPAASRSTARTASQSAAPSNSQPRAPVAPREPANGSATGSSRF
jgi:hypothetical protein